MPLNPLSSTIILNTIKDHYECNTRPYNVGRHRTLSYEYILDRIMYVLETGCQWSHVEVCNGSWKTIYHYFSLWSKAHLFSTAYQHILNVYQKSKRIGDKILVDTSFIKNIFGRDCIGPSPFDRGRNATKVSAVVDDTGIPLAFTFHPGNKNDSRTLFHTLRKSHIDLKGKKLYADKIYDTEHCRHVIQNFEMKNMVSKKKCITPSSDNRVRIVVEHTFSWLDKFRRIIVRYDGSVSRLRSFHYLAASQITGRRVMI